MAKKNADINDMLDDAPSAKGKKPAAPAKKAAEPVKAAPAPEPVKGKKPPAKAEVPVKGKKPADEEEAPAARAPRPPIEWEEGERDGIYDGVAAHFKKNKKPINSKDLAAKLGTTARKLRAVLYVLKARGTVTLESTESRNAGMTVSPA